MDISIVTAAERPDLIPFVWDMPDAWPEFINHDLISEALFSPVAAAHRDLAVIAVDSADRIVGHATAMTFRFDHDGRRHLPAAGWDQALVWAQTDLARGTVTDVACALEASVHPEWMGRGLSQRLIAGLRDAARAKGLDTLLAPVRPSDKHLEPHTPMSEYAGRTRADGLPADRWLRVHVRLGGVIEQVAPVSQTISGTLEQWSAWTGVAFDAPGPIIVPNALAPVQSMPDEGYAVYVEPNVWVRHTLT